MDEYGLGWMSRAQREQREQDKFWESAEAPWLQQESLASAARNAPATVDRMSSPAEVGSAARFIWGQLEQLFGPFVASVDEDDPSAVPWESLGIEDDRARRRPHEPDEEWGQTTSMPRIPLGLPKPVEDLILGSPLLRPFLQRPAVTVTRRHLSMAILAHELTHVYLTGQASGAAAIPDSKWVHEGLADYAKDVLGYGGSRRGLGDPFIGDPTEGYGAASRFFMWMEARWPNSVRTLAQQIAAGADYSYVMAEITGGAMPSQLLDLYAREPLVPEAEGKMARYLRPQTQDPAREKSLMRAHQSQRDPNFGRNMGRTTPSEVRQYPSPPTGRITLGGIDITPDEPEAVTGTTTPSEINRSFPKPPPARPKPRPAPLPGVAKSR